MEQVKQFDEKTLCESKKAQIVSLREFWCSAKPQTSLSTMVSYPFIPLILLKFFDIKSL
jgi:hypothetical protein